MMDRDWRLQRYQHKDYTDVVEFPVEIVGRDGGVRRYTFEDSIRLYQRRVTFAPLRYRDPTLVEAEVAHCRSRIDQLRRSFFFRHGWGTADGRPQATDSLGNLTGELAAFFCRVLRVSERPDIVIEPAHARAGKGNPSTDDPTDRAGEGSGGHLPSVWSVTAGVGAAATRVGFTRTPPMRLYVFRFEAGERDKSRDGFFRTLRRVDAPAASPDAERLVAFHHTADCGIVLTSDGPSPIDGADDADAFGVEDPHDPWAAVLAEVRAGEHPRALATCRALVRDQPWHRKAYVLGAALAAHLELPHLSEDLATLGARYFPGDPYLWYFAGLARARLGRWSEALVALREAQRVDPTATPAAAAVALTQVARGAPWMSTSKERSTIPGIGASLTTMRRLVVANHALTLGVVTATTWGAWSHGPAAAAVFGAAAGGLLLALGWPRWFASRSIREPAFADLAASLLHVRALADAEPREH